ncbi:DUF3761 domain-containing protein [Candidatus Peregrinibacteria bacterium]|nr:DUF3761 domain-containing protein [Candidatus Peregrinibacteria bacterium]
MTVFQKKLNKQQLTRYLSAVNPSIIASQNRRGTCSHHGGVAEWL